MSINIDFRPLITKNPADCTIPEKEKISTDEFVDLFSSLVDTMTPGDMLEIAISGPAFRQLLAHPYMNTIATYFNPENVESLPGKKEVLEKVESNSLTRAITAFNFSMTRFLDGYSRLNELDHEGHSFRSRVLDYLTNLPQYEANAALVDHIRFLSREEYHHLLSAVEKAARLYEQGLKGQHSPDVAHEVNEKLLNPEMAGALEEIAADLKNAETQLRKALDARFAAENRSFQMEFNRIYQACFEFEEKLTLFISLFGNQDIIKPGMLTLDKTIKSRYDQFQNLQREGTKLRNEINRVAPDRCRENKTESVSQLLELNDQFRFALAEWKAVSLQLIEENLTRLNRLNAQDEILNERADVITDCLARLNGLSVFKSHLEFNSSNFIQLQRFAGNLVKKIGEAIGYCRSYPAMVAWKSFYSGLEPTSRDLISRLINHEPVLWIPMVKSAFLYLRIGQYMHPAIVRHNDTAEEATRNFSEAMRLKGKFDFLKLMAFYENATKNKPTPIFFNPFSQNVRKTGGDAMDDNAQEKITMQNFPLRFKWKHQHESTVQLKVKTVSEEFVYEFVLDLNIDWIQLEAIDRGIDAYPVTDRFRVAELVSKAFASYAPEVSLFQFKSANVIGVLPESFSKVLAEEWKALGVKQFSVQNRLCDAIIESIIETGRKQVMFVFNGLLDDQRPEQLMHQQRILKAFTMLGFEVVPVWSVSLMEDYRTEIIRLSSILGLTEKT